MTARRKLVISATISVVIGALIIGLKPGYGGDDGASSTSEPVAAPIQAPTEKNAPEKEPIAKTKPLPPAKEEAKPRIITMSEAVNIAEKRGRGYALKAERSERPNLSFKIDIMGIDGSKVRIDLAADGKVIQKSAGPQLNELEKKGGKGKRPGN